MNIAYGVCSIGLGHATRSIPFIKKLIDMGHNVTVLTHGRALELLKKEANASFVDFEDYPLNYSANPHLFFITIFKNWPILVHALLKEHERFLKLDAKYNFDIIISDNRYGIFVNNKPSFLITHQLRIMNPYRIKILEHGTLLFSKYIANRFNAVLVPDMEHNSLSGDLSHHLKYINLKKIHYIGPISYMQKKDVYKDIDLIITISGPEPQRSMFEKIMLAQTKTLNLNYKIILGRPEVNIKNARIISYLSFKERELLFNRSKLFVARSGYSTIMDLYTIGAKAIFVPTPYQPEQEYLAQYHQLQNTIYATTQDTLNLQHDIEQAKKYRGFAGGYDYHKTVTKFVNYIFGDS